MGREFERWYDRTMKLVPAAVSHRIDGMRPSLRTRWGGPLNGQEGRQQIVRDLNRAVAFDRVYETGTYRGTTTEFFLAVFECPVFTVEVGDRFYRYSRKRLSYSSRLHIDRGDCRAFLRRHANPDDTVFVYLDAHWREDLLRWRDDQPLHDELAIVAAGWPRAVVMIDDFQVPDDLGYAFDDYGPGKRLGPELLSIEDRAEWSLFYPTIRSEEETGARRGCCVLARGDVDIAQLSSLRPG